MTTRSQLLLLLRKLPGSTVTDLAESLHLSNMGVRRHLEVLVTEGLVATTDAPRPSADRSAVGRPPVGWRLTPAGDETFPRRYDLLAVEVLEDIAEGCGPDVLEAALARRTDKVAAAYEERLEDAPTLPDRIRRLTGLRDDDGYLAECTPQDDGDFLLVENNCAVHRVARRFPILCAMELSLFRRCLGPGVEVTRESHALSGDAVCCYRISESSADENRR